MGKPTGFLEYNRKICQLRPPEERINDFNDIHGEFDIELIREQASRCMNCGVPFCHGGVASGNSSSGCPKQNLIPEWNDLVYKGFYKDAWERLFATMPFPEFTGSLCPALCEGACTCSLHDEAVIIREIERFLADMAYNEGWIKPEPPKTRTGISIAIVGSGPAGLSAAYYLNKLGHKVTVYERNDFPGGLLMYGIPNMKLDKNLLKKRISIMEEEGIKFKTGIDVGKNQSLAKLISSNDVVLLACGSTTPRDLQVPGRELENIMFAVPYLEEATKNLLSGTPQRNLEGKNVIIIGGGDTGNDCVATALRQGCRNIKQFEIVEPLPDSRTSNNPWPTWPFIKKTDYGQQEAIALLGEDPREYCISTTLFYGRGKVEGLHTVKVKWVKEKGQRIMKTIQGSEKSYPADLVILAMGFTGPEKYVTEEMNIRKREDFNTNIPGVFMCGDMRRGQSLVVWAIDEGYRAALRIKQYLEGR